MRVAVEPKMRYIASPNLLSEGIRRSALQPLLTNRNIMGYPRAEHQLKE